VPCRINQPRTRAHSRDCLTPEPPPPTPLPGGRYGAAARVYGPTDAESCRRCPLSLTTADTNPALGPAAAAAVVNNGSAACVPRPGVGWEGGGPARCAGGKFSPGYMLEPCASCPGNMTTPDADPSMAPEAAAVVVNAAASDCVTLPGYGFDSGLGAAAQCPEGTYAPGYTRDGCAACPGGEGQGGAGPGTGRGVAQSRRAWWGTGRLLRFVATLTLPLPLPLFPPLPAGTTSPAGSTSAAACV
jgi:hypothetical protein